LELFIIYNITIKYNEILLATYNSHFLSQETPVKTKTHLSNNMWRFPVFKQQLTYIKPNFFNIYLKHAPSTNF
jgi:hypothetical protein